jgi:hypothetical protein
MDHQQDRSTVGTPTGRPFAQPLYVLADQPLDGPGLAAAASDELRRSLQARRDQRGADAAALPISALGGTRAGDRIETVLQRARTHMEAEVPALQAEGFDVLRPVAVCFAGTGLGRSSRLCFADPEAGASSSPGPNVPRLPRTPANRAAIFEFLSWPHLVVFGMEGSDSTAVCNLATAGAFEVTDRHGVVDGIRTWGDALACEVLDVVGYGPKDDVVIPTVPEGFRALR